MQLVAAVPEETELRGVSNRERNNARLPQPDHNIRVSLSDSPLTVLHTYVINHACHEYTHLDGAWNSQEGRVLSREV